VAGDTLRKEAVMLDKLTTFGILAADGQRWVVEANRVRLRRDGCLVFLAGLRRVVAVANAGTWQNVVEGVTLEGIEDKG